MKVTMSAPTPRWRDEFERHRTAIRQTLAAFDPAVEHIGSTALGDIAAKPIVDVLVGLTDDRHLDAVVAPMLQAGYTYVAKFNAGMPWRRFFVELVPLRGGPLPRIIGDDDALAFGRHYDSVANIHVVVGGTPHWERHIAFRDYLRAHAEVRHAYEALKRGIAMIDFADPLEYNAHKQEFIAEHEERAVAWHRRGRSD